MKNMFSDFSLHDKGNLARLITGAAVFSAGIVLDNTVQPFTLTLIIFIAAYIILGFDIILRSLGNLLRGKVFDENFLMSIATIGAFLIGESPEAAGVMLFYQIGEFFQEMAVRKSKKSITDLMDIRPDYANLIKDSGIVKVSPDTVNVGDKIIIKPGEKIPLDGIVIEGNSMIDTAALTGESVPKKADVSSAVLSGCVNISGKLTIQVTKTFGESAVSIIINLVENSAGRKAKTENFITKFARIYTPVVVILSVLLAIIPVLFFSGEWKIWIHRALVFLVISCPCALVLSIPMGFFAGIGRAARSGILVKGGNYLEAFNHLKTVVFDKTGTLTKGVFKVTSVTAANEFSGKELLELAAKAEKFSNHPIALSIIEKYNEQLSDNNERITITDYTEIAGCGVSVNFDGKVILAGNQKLMERNGIDFTESQSTGTKVYVAYNGLFAGCIVISDEIKPDSRDAVSALKERGVRKTVMLTGDDPLIAESIAGIAGIDEFHGGLLPHEKVRIVEELNAQKNADGKRFLQRSSPRFLQRSSPRSSDCLAFVGDGINDAPVLAMADIGVAMGALGSDAAIEAADVVLMTDEPSKLANAVDIARYTGKIVRQNIIFVMAVKAVFLILGAFGIASMWEAVFADVGVSLLAVLNAMRILKYSA